MLWANWVADRAGVENGRRQTGFRQPRKGLLLVAAGGFHGHQFHLLLTTEDRQLGNNAFGRSGNDAAAPSRPMRASSESDETSTPQITRVTVTFLVCAIEIMRLFGRA